MTLTIRRVFNGTCSGCRTGKTCSWPLPHLGRSWQKMEINVSRMHHDRAKSLTRGLRVAFDNIWAIWRFSRTWHGARAFSRTADLFSRIIYTSTLVLSRMSCANASASTWWGKLVKQVYLLNSAILCGSFIKQSLFGSETGTIQTLMGLKRLFKLSKRNISSWIWTYEWWRGWRNVSHIFNRSMKHCEIAFRSFSWKSSSVACAWASLPRAQTTASVACLHTYHPIGATRQWVIARKEPFSGRAKAWRPHSCLQEPCALNALIKSKHCWCAYKALTYPALFMWRNTTRNR